MNVIITLAGHSRRFAAAGYTVPKAFIEINGLHMISHVVDMFDPNDNFYFALNKMQVQEFPDAIKILEGLVVNSKVIVIEPHELGPVYTVLQVKKFVKSEEPVIISYCDFIVEWNYKLFLKEVYGYDAAIAAFRGFHPASYGNTYYAYIRTNNHEMIELREKKSFTCDRTKEYASAGIYYFSTWNLFEHHAVNFFEGDYQKTLLEAYVSLLYNSIVQQGGSVRVTKVDKFICWGTPEDLEQYLFWQDYFKNSAEKFRRCVFTQCNGDIIQTKVPKSINLMPMAGKGSRFREDGYRVSKPLIQVLGKPMAVCASLSFPDAEHWIFLLNEAELDKHPIEKAFLSFKPQADFIGVKQSTSGQAATCLLAKDKLHPEAHLFIASCDYQTIYNEDLWQNIINDESIDGAIWTFRMRAGIFKNYNAFAYCRVAEDKKTILEIIEKKTISDKPELDPAVVGSFWFRKASDFVYGAEKMISRNILVNGEHYVGTSINELLKIGRRFVIFDIEQWISLGDPFELQVFEYWESHFSKKLTSSKLK